MLSEDSQHIVGRLVLHGTATMFNVDRDFEDVHRLWGFEGCVYSGRNLHFLEKSGNEVLGLPVVCDPSSFALVLRA